MCTCCDSKQNRQHGLQGPVGRRSCRDMLWLLLFVGFWVGMITIASFSFKNGNPLRLLYGVDRYRDAVIYNSETFLLA
jgi:solute carrier family 44 (choline transporter-like protein), member 1